MNGLFKVKHPPTWNSVGLLGSASSRALQCYCVWKDETGSQSNTRGAYSIGKLLQYRESASSTNTNCETILSWWQIQKFGRILCSALILHSCLYTVIQRGTNNVKCCRCWNHIICCIPIHLNMFRWVPQINRASGCRWKPILFYYLFPLFLEKYINT